VTAYVYNTVYGELFKTGNKEVIKACQEYFFCFRLPNDLIET